MRDGIRKLPVRSAAGFRREVRDLFLHLRLPFQFLLSPIFVLGLFASEAVPRASWLVTFLIVHVGLYGGATAFNGYHDRDSGPIAFLKRPPAPWRRLELYAVAIQVLSILALTTVRPLAGLVASIMVLAGTAYSHPKWRWKASTWGSTLAVSLGQGMGGFFLGYLVPGGNLPPSLDSLLLAGAAGLVTAGIYPITQAYQIEEDRERGDITLPVRVGWRATLLFSAIATSMGLSLLAVAGIGYIPSIGIAASAAAPVFYGFALAAWWRRFDGLDPGRNHDWAMGIGVGAAIYFWLILILAFSNRWNA